MNLAQTIMSKLKACKNSAQGKAAGRHPGLMAIFVTTLKGLQSLARVCLAPFQGAEIILNRYPGYRFAQPWAEFLQPFRLPELAYATRDGRR